MGLRAFIFNCLRGRAPQKGFMRCNACDRLLSDYEATRKHALTGDYLDLCNPCFAAVSEVTPLPVRDRKDLITEVDIDQEMQEIDDNQEL